MGGSHGRPGTTRRTGPSHDSAVRVGAPHSPTSARAGAGALVLAWARCRCLGDPITRAARRARGPSVRTLGAHAGAAPTCARSSLELRGGDSGGVSAVRSPHGQAGRAPPDGGHPVAVGGDGAEWAGRQPDRAAEAGRLLEGPVRAQVPQGPRPARPGVDARAHGHGRLCQPRHLGQHIPVRHCTSESANARPCPGPHAHRPAPPRRWCIVAG